MLKMTRLAARFCLAGMLVWLGMGWPTGAATGDITTNAAVEAGTNGLGTAPAPGPESLRSYLEIQDQLHNTQLAIERNRREAESAATLNSEIMQGRLNLLEKALASHRADELKDMEQSNRLILVSTGSFVVIGFLVLLLAAFLQWTSTNRLAAIAARFPEHPLSSASPAGAVLGSGENSLPRSKVLEQTEAPLAGVIGRLEERIQVLESSARPRHLLSEGAPSKGADGANRTTRQAVEVLTQETREAPPDLAGTVGLQLGRGQILLRLDQAEEALACFENVLALDAGNTEALVKKGAALERMQRLEEAVVCYDGAIARDHSLTVAYLHKAGALNRLERFSEALECYEKALKTQDKGRSEEVVAG